MESPVIVNDTRLSQQAINDVVKSGRIDSFFLNILCSIEEEPRTQLLERAGQAWCTKIAKWVWKLENDAINLPVTGKGELCTHCNDHIPFGGNIYRQDCGHVLCSEHESDLCDDPACIILAELERKTKFEVLDVNYLLEAYELSDIKIDKKGSETKEVLHTKINGEDSWIEIEDFSMLTTKIAEYKAKKDEGEWRNKKENAKNLKDGEELKDGEKWGNKKEDEEKEEIKKRVAWKNKRENNKKLEDEKKLEYEKNQSESIEELLAREEKSKKNSKIGN